MARVYLAVGHGLRDDGTFDPGARDGAWTEQTAGDVIIKAAADYLAPVDRLAVRHEAYSDDPNYQGTPDDARDWGADIVVSAHHDWIQGIPAMFAFWDPDDPGDSKRLADAIRDSVVAAGFPHRADWHRARDNLGLLNDCVRYGITCVLVEVGRVGQPDIDTDAERRQMGRAIAAGVLDHLDLPDPHEGDDVTPQDIDDIAHATVKKLRQDKRMTRVPLDAHVLDSSKDDPKATIMVADIHKATHNRLKIIEALVRALAAEHDGLAASIADAEGLTVEEARAAISEALSNIRLTVDEEQP